MAIIRSIRHFVWGEVPATKTERRLLLKIDWFILSYCCLMVRLFATSTCLQSLTVFSISQTVRESHTASKIIALIS